MDLQYNPLLRDNLQYSGGGKPPAPTYDDALSDTSENAVQNRIITEEITKITDTQTKKVTKFFESIEELEEGEIGEYQGESNENFTAGYFYKRGTGSETIKQNFISNMEFVYEITSTLVPGGVKQSAFLQPNAAAISTAVVNSESSNSISVFILRIPGVSSIYFFVLMLPFDFTTIGGISVDSDMDAFVYYNSGYFHQHGVIPPYAYDGSSSEESQYYPLKIDKGHLLVLYNDSWTELRPNSYYSSIPGWPIYHVYCNYGSIVDAFILPIALGRDVVFPYRSDNVLDMASLRVYPYAKYSEKVYNWNAVEKQGAVYSFSRIFDPAQKRVNTQPPFKSQSLALTTDSAGNVDTNLTLADIVPLCAYDTYNDVRLMLSVNNAQHIIITPASYSDATTRYPDTSFNCVLFYIEVPTA